jgi:hypothetical protein
MALTFRDYSADQVEAARSVLLELVHLLGEYRDDIVVVGGWVPQLILPPGPTPHVGSIDVDLALNHRNLTEAGEATSPESSDRQTTWVQSSSLTLKTFRIRKSVRFACGTPTNA